MYHYLAESAKAAEHRASVARYANLDGQEENPGVRTLAVWAGRCGDPRAAPRTAHMEGAENVTIPNTTHVQSSTSAQTFQQIFKFFRDKLPKHDIVPQKKDPARRQGARIPAEHGADRRHGGSLAAQLQRRTDDHDAARVVPDHRRLRGRRRVGPGRGQAGQRYEFALVTPAKTIHVYMEPFVRSDYAIRLLGSVPISRPTPASSPAARAR